MSVCVTVCVCVSLCQCVCVCLFPNSSDTANPNEFAVGKEFSVDASCGYSHFLSVFWVNAVNNHYNFVVA